MTPTTAPHPDKIAERVGRAATRRGVDAKPVVISAVATSCLFLGADDDLRATASGALGRLAHEDPDRFTAFYTGLWDAQAATFPYLTGHLRPFTGWLDRDPTGMQVQALGSALVECAELDLHASAEADGVQGDLLGQVLMAVEAPGDRKARGAFYTPTSVAALLGAIATPGNFERFNDPCCGAGGLAVASIRAMRRAGRVPETVQWVLNDLDPTAVACAGVAMAIHGMPHVVLSCENALTPAGATA